MIEFVTKESSDSYIELYMIKDGKEYYVTTAYKDSLLHQKFDEIVGKLYATDGLYYSDGTFDDIKEFVDMIIKNDYRFTPDSKLLYNNNIGNFYTFSGAIVELKKGFYFQIYSLKNTGVLFPDIQFLLDERTTQ